MNLILIKWMFDYSKCLRLLLYDGYILQILCLLMLFFCCCWNIWVNQKKEKRNFHFTFINWINDNCSDACKNYLCIFVIVGLHFIVKITFALNTLPNLIRKKINKIKHFCIENLFLIDYCRIIYNIIWDYI